MEKSTTRKELERLRDTLEENALDYIEELRLTDEHVTDEDIIDTAKYMIDLANSIIAKLT